MHCGVMVTGYNQGDWERLLAGDYDRPPTVPDATQFDATLALGELVEPLGFDSIWATEHYGSAYSMQPNPLQYLAYWAGRTSARRRGDRGGRGAVVEPGAARERALDARHPACRGGDSISDSGRGVAPHEYASLGVPQERSHDYFYEIVDILRAADGVRALLLRR